MPAAKSLVPLSLKQKIYLSLVLYIFSIVLLGSLSFYDLVRIGARVNLMADFGQLTSVILEVRRFEKNYLLYQNASDLEETRTYLTQAQTFIDDLYIGGEKRNEGLKKLLKTIHEYSATLYSLPSAANMEGGFDPHAVEKLRDAGKRMVDLAEGMSHLEKNRIGNILGMLKMQLTASVVCALLLGLIGTKVLFGKLLNAMDVIVKATRSIGQGRFDALPEVGTQQETRPIIRALNQMTHELERRQEQLVQAQKLSSLGTLTAGIAHQLNNPLNNISTSSQIAFEELGESNLELQRKMLGNIEQESARAKEIVQGLLEFSRERSFSPSLALVSELVDKTLRLVSSQLPPGVTIRTNVPPEMNLSIDMQRMQEALLNLVINASQAMPTGGGEITIHAGYKEKEGNSIPFISVEDTGAGISREDLNRVFDPFFTTKEERVGTGLGLSIVYGIVEKHGGCIDVQSEQGQGTIFSIMFPEGDCDNQKSETAAIQ